MQFHELQDSRGSAKDVTHVGHWGNGDVEVGLTESEELPYVMGLIRQALEKAAWEWRKRGLSNPPNTSGT